MTHNPIQRQATTPCADLHVRENSTDNATESRVIEGYAILFDTPSDPLWADETEEAREVIAPEAVTRQLLDASDIKFTMFHDRQLILGRSDHGTGTLTYEIDSRGVKFSLECPRTADGDKALELVRRGDIKGCSFAFSTRYFDTDCVERTVTTAPGGRCLITYRVKVMTGIYDMTLAADPAYPATNVEARQLREMQPKPSHAERKTQPREMRATLLQMKRNF